jgi:hypothetical protein
MNTLLPMTGTGRTEVVAERAFVRSLARYWTEELGARLRISRGDGGYGEKSSEQSGLFPDFVHAAAEIIPPEYRPVSWDHTVREIVEQKT